MTRRDNKNQYRYGPYDYRTKNEDLKLDRADRERKATEDAWRRASGGGGSCFVGSAEVLTPSGPLPIVELQAGDVVVAYDQNLRGTRFRRITERREHGPVRIWELHLEGRSFPIRTTRAHTFLTARGWRRVSELKKGDVLIALGREEVVESIKATGVTEPVFNLVVGGECTFVVEGCVVHCFSYFRGIRIWWQRNQGRRNKDCLRRNEGRQAASCANGVAVVFPH